MKNLPKIADIFLSLKSSVACESVGGKADSSNERLFILTVPSSKTFACMVMTSVHVKTPALLFSKLCRLIY